jgi:hypothetical protein
MRLSIHHEGGYLVEVVEQLNLDLLRGLGLPETCQHVFHPGVSLHLTDGKGHMAPPEPGVSALLAVGVRPTKILNQEQVESSTGTCHVFGGVHGYQERVLLDGGIETVDQGYEELVSAHSFVNSHVLSNDPALSLVQTAAFRSLSPTVSHGVP